MEIKSLNCPNCSAPLDVAPGDTAIECSHCGSDLRISSTGEATLFFRTPTGQPSGPPGVDMAEVERLVRAGKPLPTPPPARGYPRPSQTTHGTPDWTRIREQLAAGRKIEAIKIYREQTGVGLKEAKDAVEMFERGQAPPPPSSPTPPLTIPGNVNMDEIRQLLAVGKKIDAVKRYREQTGLGLKEALNVIDAMPEARSAAGGATGGKVSWGCARVLVMIAGFIVLILGGCGLVVQRGDLYQCAVYDITHDLEVVQALGEPIQTYPIVFVLGYESSSDFFGNSSVNYGALTYIKGARAGSLVQISADHSTGFLYHVAGDLNPNGQKIRVFSSGDIESCTR
ncbi:MAG TPA: ribosomal protein L7/L12 [Anaerolineales bacterium]|nr:ribosomal protein L7/L12 [Anaerolineales bacterium]